MSGDVSTVRRVIVGEKNGKSFVAIDEQVEPIIAGGGNANDGQQLWQIWGADGPPKLPDDASENFAKTLFAPTGGYRVHICEFPAESGSSLVPRGAWPQLGTMLGRSDTGEVSDQLGDITDRIMHFTDSIDIMVILTGELTIELDGGVDVTLRAGDVLVNTGAPHAWKNGPVPCKCALFYPAAERTRA